MRASKTAATESTLPMAMPSGDSTHRWFSATGCVVWGEDGVRRVYAGGSLITFFTERDVVNRNTFLVGLAQDPGIHLGKLAWAFGISEETLRLLRRRFEKGGFAGILQRGKAGRPREVTAEIVRRLEKAFEQGKSVRQARREVVKGDAISVSTVGQIRKAWAARQAAAPKEEPPTQLPLRVEAKPVDAPRPPDADKANVPAKASSVPPIRAPNAPDESERAVRTSPQAGSPDEDLGVIEPVLAAAPKGRRLVQFAGAWLLVALVARLGVYDAARSLCAAKLSFAKLRVALDAVAIALAVGEQCVEGVRRLATRSAAALLLATHAPSASWVRRTLGRFAADDAGVQLHWAVGGELLRRAGRRAGEGPVVFYVDNHLRPYTGKRRVRWGWRMQDKRARPGVTDYWIHDVDGRPLWRVAVPAHDSLASFLVPIAIVLRATLGDGPRILIAFDRGGSYPQPLGELRLGNVEFVTYERRPFTRLARRAFDRTLELDGEKVGLCESQANLGGGRGRVRRVSLRMRDGRQVNLLAVSEEDAASLVRVMSGRWCQENGFKHGVERWGMNQLDGRRFVPYAPDEVIPNPARRRLDRTLDLLRASEGALRNKLARLAEAAPDREPLQRELEVVLASQRDAEALRPQEPEHVTVDEAGLTGDLVKHVDEYKAVIDTVRVAAANVETDLAAELVPNLARPREAKRVLRNIFKSPGSVIVADDSITVRLDIAGTRDELEAIHALFRTVNRWQLRLPGDPKGRRLCFRSQKA